ncbi:type II restriction endonuclease [Polaromonas sp. YR568]|uniref:type II restriction endonuclease n=1 Tax=Polaromonas sp. YR568 TaxID=1855301 RepID=UPI003137F32E
MFEWVEKLVMPVHIARDPGKSFSEPEEKTIDLLESLIKSSERVLVKKLANNDRNWAIWDAVKRRYKSNQAGPLFPEAARIDGFFPPLVQDAKISHNHSVDIEVWWPATGKYYESRFIWYSAKGPAENHLTTNPRSEFSDLAPASFLLLFKSKDPGARFRGITVDSRDEDLCEYLDEIFGVLQPDFSFREFLVKDLNLNPALTALQALAKEVLQALLKGPAFLDSFVRSLSKRTPASIASEALSEWRAANRNATLDPYLLPFPGDTLHELTRSLEFSIYRKDEAAYYGPLLINAIYGTARSQSPEDVVKTVIENFDAIYRICLSASQTRKSRAGGSFEAHMAHMLRDGNVPHFAQPVFDGRTPDFVLPSKKIYLESDEVRSKSALVLTLKTTLRERWTQVVSETAGCPIFLATLDETVPKATLDKLEKASVRLVVPERFKTSDFAEYEAHKTVITYKSFFQDIERSKKRAWRAAGIPCFSMGN